MLWNSRRHDDNDQTGLCSALIRSAIEWSRARGFARVSVATGAANTRALKVYERLGFEEESITLSIAT